MPRTIGTKSTAINGRVRVLASSRRRIDKPHAPPVMCCNMLSGSEPSAMPNQNRYPSK
jgi:hypothetical protein